MCGAGGALSPLLTRIADEFVGDYLVWDNSTCGSYPLVPSVSRRSWKPGAVLSSPYRPARLLQHGRASVSLPQAVSLVYAAHSEDFQSRNFFPV